MVEPNHIYKINTPVEVRYVAIDKLSGMTDLVFVYTSPSQVDSAPVSMTEIQPGIYRAYFTPDAVGYWWVRVYSTIHPENSYTTDFFVSINYGYLDITLMANSSTILIDGGILKSNLSVDNLITIDGRDISVDGSNLDSHISNVSNPHVVTKAQVNLSNVPNIDATNPANIVQNSTHRFITDAYKARTDEGDLRISNLLSTGLIYGGELSINALDDTKFDIAAGAGIIVNNYTDPANPTRQIISWSAQIGISTPFLTITNESGIEITPAGLVEVYGDPIPQDAHRREDIHLGWVSHVNRTNLDLAYSEPLYGFDVFAQLTDFFENFGAFNIDGNNFSIATVGGLKLHRSAGKTFDNNANYSTSRKNPNIVASPDEDEPDIYYYYRTSGANWVDDVPVVTSIDPNYYDTGTSLDVVPNDKWTIQSILFYAPTLSVDIQYGQKIYDSLALAESDLTAAVDINPYLDSNTFRAWLIVKEGATDLSDIAQAKFVSAGKLGLVSVASGGGAGGEVNTATNVGDGVGVFKVKTGVEFEFKSIKANSTKISVSSVGDTVNIDANITKSDVGLSAVTNDIQAKADFSGYTAKSDIVDADVVIINDSEAAGAIKKSAWSNIKSVLKTYFDSLYTLANLGGVPTSRTVNGYALSSNVTITKSDVLLSNVPNLDTTNAVNNAHTRSHAITSSSDHTSSATTGQMLKADANGLPINATNTDTDVSDAVTKKHAANTQFNQSVNGEINGLTEKTVPVAGDVVLIEDSASSYSKKKIQFANIPSEYYYAESLGESSTIVNLTYQDKVTLTFTPLVAGDYILEWYCEHVNSNGGKLDKIRIYQNGSITVSETVATSLVEHPNYVSYAGFAKLTLTQASNTFILQWNRVANTSYIKNARLIARRLI